MQSRTAPELLEPNLFFYSDFTLLRSLYRYLDDLVLGWNIRIAQDSHHEASLSPRVSFTLAVRVGPVNVGLQSIPDVRLYFL